MNSERGQALPLALLALAAGMLLIVPFANHIGGNLLASRIYGQVMSEQYSCDAGVEWALWKLKGNPVLTTSTSYESTALEPFPGEINGSSFPATELQFVEDARATETITPQWQDGQGEHTYDFQTTDKGTITVVIDNIIASSLVRVELSGVPGQPDYEFQRAGPYEAKFEIGSADSYTISVILPGENEYRALVKRNPIIITITYPIASYDIRAQKGDCVTTVRATASYLTTRVISWQIE